MGATVTSTLIRPGTNQTPINQMLKDASQLSLVLRSQ